jgi:predicted dehydrogenase
MSGLRVAIVGCGLIGGKRADALAPHDTVIGCYDIDAHAASSFAARHACVACASVQELLALAPEVVVVATAHNHLAGYAEQALAAGAHVLVEKPAGINTEQIGRLIELQRDRGLLVKVGFNHRFHPALERLAAELRLGTHGQLMHLRAHYGHGGRRGYEREWRADPGMAGGGELIDQGMHLLDLTHWLAGPLPLHCALLRTQFWHMQVEDNAALILGDGGVQNGPWAMLHVSWTEWKNTFSLEVFCRRAKLAVEGLARSYGPQRLTIHRMAPELGPPELEELSYSPEDVSWRREWRNLADAIAAGDERRLCGDLHDAHYAWVQVESAYARSPYAAMRASLAAGVAA